MATGVALLIGGGRDLVFSCSFVRFVWGASFVSFFFPSVENTSPLLIDSPGIYNNTSQQPPAHHMGDAVMCEE